MYRVFIAEDEEIVRIGIEQSLNSYRGKHRFCVCGTAEDGEMAYTGIMNLKPDIVITDIKMPFLSGLELARIVRDELPEIRFLIISGFDEFEFAKEAISLGVEEYLLKPVDAQLLFDTLEKIGENIEKTATARSDNMSGTAEEEFLQDLTSGALSVSEAYVKAREYGIDLGTKYYTVAELQFDYMNSARKAARERKAYVHSILEKQKELLFYMDGADRAVIISGVPSGEDGLPYIREFLAQINSEVHKDFNIQLTAGIGSSFPRVEGLRKSYQEAHEALNLLLGSGRGKSMTVPEIRGMYAKGKGNPRQIRDRIEHAVEEDVEELAHAWIRTTGDTDSYIYLYFRLSDFLEDLCELIRKYSTSQLDQSELFPEKALADAARSRQSAENYASDLIYKTIRILNEHRDHPDEIIVAKRFIRDHLEETEISLNLVAEHVGISPNHFSMLFSTKAGQTFTEYLAQTRIQEAKKRILQGMKTTEVAYSLGYNDVHYFCNQFKKLTGLTTREFFLSEQSQ